QVEDTRWRANEDWHRAATSNIVPLPDTTPFDGDFKARTAYLSAYQDGYRSGLTSFNICYGRPAEGYSSYNAERAQGWNEGARTATDSWMKFSLSLSQTNK